MFSRETDHLSDQVQEELLKISTDFCSWLRNLPGENSEINNTEPQDVWYLVIITS